MNFWPFRSNRDEFDAIHTHLELLGVFLMAGQAELDAKLDELKASVDKELQQLADAIAKTAPDLSPQVAKVQAAIDALNADDPAP